MVTLKDSIVQAFPDGKIRRAHTTAIKPERLKELFEIITVTEQEHEYVDMVQDESKKLQQQGAFC